MRFLKWVAGAALALGLVACGGGGDAGNSMYGDGSSGGSGSESPTTVEPTVAVTLSRDTVTSAATATATATVRTSAGAALSGVAVRFSLASSLGTLSADTVTTDASGIATTVVSVKPGQVFGADTLTAAVTVGAKSASASVGFTANSATVVELLASSNSVPSAGDQVTLTAIVKGSGNVGLSGAPISFTTDSGTLLSPSSKTDATGVATVKFTAGADKSNRSVTVSASSGSATGQIVLPVEGTKLSVSGATTMAMTSSSTLSVKATDSSGKGISGTSIAVASSLGNGLSPATVVTDSNGLGTLTYTASRSGTDTVTFSGLGTSSSTGVSISSEDFAFVLPASMTEIGVGVSQTVQVRYRVAGVGVAGRAVNFTTTGGTLSASSATTDGSGVATVTVSSASAAPATIQAQLVGGTAQATVPVVFVAKTPYRLVLQVTPTAIGPNVGGGTTNQSQVVAKVTDVNANPVAGATVNFSRDADPSGGNFLQPSGLTDVNGIATVQYASGPQSTANNAVLLRGTVSDTAVTGTASMTVSQSALFIALGTGNTITNLDPQTYRKQWTVYVTDANGVAVPNVSITAKVLPTAYRKGSMIWVEDPGVWGTGLWDGSSTVTDALGGRSLPAGSYISCPNEDLRFGENDARSFNGVLDGATEDVNGNGLLEPGNVISLESGSVKTDATGRATLSLVYAESYVPWVEVRLQVQAVVSGTASITEASFVVVGLADDFTKSDIPPAGQTSPFGRRTVCTDRY